MISNQKWGTDFYLNIFYSFWQIPHSVSTQRCFNVHNVQKRLVDFQITSLLTKQHSVHFKILHYSILS